jgi:UDP-glucose 4-epimerase
MAWSLADAGKSCVIIDDLSEGTDRFLCPSAIFYRGNVGDSDLVASILSRHGITAVVHFAGSIVVPESVADPLKYYWNNTVNSCALLKTCIAQGIQAFLFSSTAAVYGEPACNPIAEDTPLSPQSPYGSSKLMTELMLRDAAAAYGLRYGALRYFNVAGADPSGRTGQCSRRATHLIKIACEAAIGRRPSMDIYGTDYPTHDGTCIRDYIHVADLANAHLLVLQQLLTGRGSLVANCGYGRGYSVREVVDCVKSVSQCDFQVRYAPRRAGDPSVLVADPTRLRTITGWQPRFADLERIVEDALAWEKLLLEEQT